MSLIRMRGIGGASVAGVMKGAGLTVGGLYAHFGSKDALIEAALRRTGSALRERLFTELESKPEADRALVILKRYVSLAHRDATDGCPLPAVVSELATSAAEQRTHESVTHEFFGMGAVVDDAQSAEEYAGKRLKDAFEG